MMGSNACLSRTVMCHRCLAKGLELVSALRILQVGAYPRPCRNQVPHKSSRPSTTSTIMASLPRKGSPICMITGRRKNLI